MNIGPHPRSILLFVLRTSRQAGVHRPGGRHTPVTVNLNCFLSCPRMSGPTGWCLASPRMTDWASSLCLCVRRSVPCCQTLPLSQTNRAGRGRWGDSRSFWDRRCSPYHRAVQTGAVRCELVHPRCCRNHSRPSPGLQGESPEHTGSRTSDAAPLRETRSSGPYAVVPNGTRCPSCWHLTRFCPDRGPGTTHLASHPCWQFHASATGLPMPESLTSSSAPDAHDLTHHDGHRPFHSCVQSRLHFWRLVVLRSPVPSRCRTCRTHESSCRPDPTPEGTTAAARHR